MERSLHSFLSRVNHPSIPPLVFNNPVPQLPAVVSPGLSVHVHPMQGSFAPQGAAAAPTIYTREYLQEGGLPPMMPFTRELGLLWTTPPAISQAPVGSSASGQHPTRVTSSAPSIECNTKTHLFVTFGNEKVVFERKLFPPAPPAKHFSNDIDSLFKEWHQSNLLMIGDRGIPIKYWDLIYKAKASGNSAGWSVLRNEWGSWKVSLNDIDTAMHDSQYQQFIVEERDRLGSDQAFGDKFKDSRGNRLSYQTILNQLKEERKQRNERDYEEAFKIFNGDFYGDKADGMFLYTKDTELTKFSDHDRIARKWRALKAENPDIVAQLTASQIDDTLREAI